MSLLPWAVATPRAGGMPHVQVRHQEPRASEQRVGHAAGCCKTRCVWACGTPRGPSNVLPVPLPCVVHVLPAANARRRNKTTLDLSNASKNRLKSGVSYATQHALFNGRVCFPIDCKFCCMPRTNKRKKGKFALRSWRNLFPAMNWTGPGIPLLPLMFQQAGWLVPTAALLLIALIAGLSGV